jgi:nucleoside-diphosphate-sugar epimerase
VILLTGATGFFGSILARRFLAAGYRVRAVHRAGSSFALLGEDASRMEWVEANLFDPYGLGEAMEGVEAVVHAAAIVSFDRKEAGLMWRTNGDGTGAVVDAALHAGTRRFVHVSSVAAIGRREQDPDIPLGQGPLIDASWPWESSKATTDYARSKHQSEREAWRGQAEGLDVLVVNPATILGGGFWDRGTARFWPRVEEGVSWYTDGGTGFVDVRDAAEATLRLLEAEAFGERYLLVGENASFRQLFEQIAGHLGAPVATRRAGPGLLRWVARWEGLRARITGGKADLNRQTAAMLSRYDRYSNAKVIARTGVSFRPLAETLADASALYQATKHEPCGIMPLDVPQRGSKADPSSVH